MIANCRQKKDFSHSLSQVPTCRKNDHHAHSFVSAEKEKMLTPSTMRLTRFQVANSKREHLNEEMPFDPLTPINMKEPLPPLNPMNASFPTSEVS